MFRVLKRLLYGGSSGFTPYENRCIEWFVERLSREASAILFAQIESRDRVVRGYKDMEVECTVGARTTPPLFPNRGAELLAARLSLRTVESRSVMCDFIFHEGRLWSVQYSVAPKLWASSEFSLEHADIYADLMSADARERRPAADRSVLPERLRSLPVTDLAAPASEQEIEKLVRMLGNCLPTDYIELLRVTDGFKLGSWVVAGLRTRRIVHIDGIFTYLAEGESMEDGDDEGLVVRQEDSEPKVYLRDEIDDEFAEMGSSFIDAFLKVALDYPEPSGRPESEAWPPPPAK